MPRNDWRKGLAAQQPLLHDNSHPGEYGGASQPRPSHQSAGRGRLQIRNVCEEGQGVYREACHTKVIEYQVKHLEVDLTQLLDDLGRIALAGSRCGGRCLRSHPRDRAANFQLSVPCRWCTIPYPSGGRCATCLHILLGSHSNIFHSQTSFQTPNFRRTSHHCEIRGPLDRV